MPPPPKKAETKINKTPQFGGKSVQSHTKTIDEPDKEKTKLTPNLFPMGNTLPPGPAQKGDYTQRSVVAVCSAGQGRVFKARKM